MKKFLGCLILALVISQEIIPASQTLYKFCVDACGTNDEFQGCRLDCQLQYENDSGTGLTPIGG